MHDVIDLLDCLSNTRDGLERAQYLLGAVVYDFFHKYAAEAPVGAAMILETFDRYAAFAQAAQELLERLASNIPESIELSAIKCAETP